jgi:Fic family protein
VGSYERLLWEPTDRSIGHPRGMTAAGPYHAFIPEAIADRSFTLTGEVAADVEDAAIAVRRLDETNQILTRTESLARLLLRAESVASSRIEGLEISPQRLLRAAALSDDSKRPPTDIRAAEVLANIDAMAFAIENPAEPITLDRILATHRRLLEHSSELAEHAGHIRTRQNWIGRSDYGPLNADFVPPPPERVPALLDDLVAFCARTDLPAVAQAAIAHAQFETIHAFIDGNGRVGRALIYMVLGNRGLATRVLPPISLVLATYAKDYVANLMAVRQTDDAEAWNGWIGFFATSCRTAVERSVRFEETIAEIQGAWRARLGPVRKNSSLELLLERLPEMPVLTVAGAARILKRSTPAANDAVNELVAGGILTPVNQGKRNRVYEARDLIDAFTSFERSLATPGGDTRRERPNRHVPSRPKRP